MKLFCSNYLQNPPITAAVHYFHYNSHHHYRFHYHCKMHLYYLKILLTIPLCNMIPCLLYRHIFFFSLIPSFSFFTPSKRTQNSFTTSRQILDVLFILIFISIVIYTSLFILTYLHFLHLLIYTYVLFILLYELHKIDKIWGM